MKKTFSKGLFIFNNDLRLHDQAALRQASLFCERLVCIFCIDEQWFRETYFGCRPMGTHRHQFLLQSLDQLDQQLFKLGHKLHIYQGNPKNIIENLVNSVSIDAVFYSHQAGYYQQHQWQCLKSRLAHCYFQSTETHSLFCQSQLQWPQDLFPDSPRAFKQSMNHQIIDPPIATITELPAPFPILTPDMPVNMNTNQPSSIHGGEIIGLQTLQQLLDNSQSHADSHTPLTDQGIGLSPWLANGSLSVKTVFARLNKQGLQDYLPDKTFWFKSACQKLLRREYYHWYACHYASKLFRYQGIHKKNPLTSIYPQRFKQWCYGNTPWQLVNAYMNQLRKTGRLSDRGRMVVASCLINELEVDWRWGAAFFEQQLIDHDVAINWASWQKIAGVGDNPKDKLHIELSSLKLSEADKAYQQQWSDNADCLSIDHVDAADWPIN